MNLYHFTDMAKLKTDGTILQHGLLIPKEESEKRFYVAGIWLTANPDPACWWEKGSFEGQCRITVDIPKTDRRLRQCKAHLRGCPPIHDIMQRTSDAHGHKWEEWYFFFGNIRPKKFRAIHVVEVVQ